LGVTKREKKAREGKKKTRNQKKAQLNREGTRRDPKECKTLGGGVEVLATWAEDNIKMKNPEQ